MKSNLGMPISLMANPVFGSGMEAELGLGGPAPLGSGMEAELGLGGPAPLGTGMEGELGLGGTAPLGTGMEGELGLGGPPKAKAAAKPKEAAPKAAI